MTARTIPELVAGFASRFGDAAAIIDGEETISYAELQSRVEAVSAAFVGLGVRPGDRVAVWAPNSGRWIESTLGLQRIGGVLVPINTRFRGEEAHYVLKRAKVRVLLTTAHFLGRSNLALLKESAAARAGGGSVVGGLPSLEHVVLLDEEDGALGWKTFVEAASARDQEAALRSVGAVTTESPIDLMFTSGTTGFPKGVLMKHGQVLATYTHMGDVIDVREKDVYLITNPFFHSFGYKAGWLTSLLKGATVIPRPVYSPTDSFTQIQTHGVTVYPAPPTVYETMLDLPDRAGYDVSSLRVAMTGAAYVPETLVRRMYSELTFERVYVGWGLTESGGVGTMTSPTDSVDVIARSIGKPFPDVHIRVVDEAGRDVKAGADGELIVNGPSVMMAYWDDETGTAAAFVDGDWLRTGDIGHRDEAGNFHITGRKNEMYIVGGFNAYPAEIESAVLENEAVSQAAVIGVPDARLGEVGALFVVARSEHELTNEQILDWCRSRLANYKVPRFIFIRDELPVNGTGKVDKKLLSQWFLSSQVGSAG